MSKTPLQSLASESAYAVTIIAPETVVVTLGATWKSWLAKTALLDTALTGVVGLTPEKSKMAPVDPVEPALRVHV